MWIEKEKKRGMEKMYSERKSTYLLSEANKHFSKDILYYMHEIYTLNVAALCKNIIHNHIIFHFFYYFCFFYRFALVSAIYFIQFLRWNGKDNLGVKRCSKTVTE